MRGNYGDAKISRCSGAKRRGEANGGDGHVNVVAVEALVAAPSFSVALSCIVDQISEERRIRDCCGSRRLTDPSQPLLYSYCRNKSMEAANLKLRLWYEQDRRDVHISEH
jgi:hypothetical protein